jgi:hypothetical protein
MTLLVVWPSSGFAATIDYSVGSLGSGRQIAPVCFLKNAFKVGQLIPVGESREPVWTDHCIDLSLRYATDIWVDGHCE